MNWINPCFSGSREKQKAKYISLPQTSSTWVSDIVKCYKTINKILLPCGVQPRWRRSLFYQLSREATPHLRFKKDSLNVFCVAETSNRLQRQRGCHCSIYSQIKATTLYIHNPSTLSSPLVPQIFFIVSYVMRYIIIGILGSC